MSLLTLLQSGGIVVSGNGVVYYKTFWEQDMQFLRQSTASQEVFLGPFVSDTDFKTAQTGLTIANTDIKIWKNGAITEVNKNSGGATHVASGRYYAVLDATDTDTVGMLELNISVSGALPVKSKYYILTQSVYDSLFATSSTGPLKPTVDGRTLDVTSTGEAGIDWANIGSPTTSVNLSGTSISTSQAIATVSGSVGSVTSGVTVTTNNDKTGYSLTQAFPSNFSSLAITAGGAVTAGTVSDKTGYSLASGGLAAVTSWSVAITGNITGNLSGSVGSVTSGVTVTTNNDKTGYSLSQAFPSNFASLSVDVSGRVLLQPTQTGVTIPTVTSVTNGVTASTVSDKTGYSLVAGTGLGNQTANITGSLSGSVGSVTGNVGGNVVGSVASVSGAVGSVTGDVGGKVLGGGAGVISGDGVRASSVTGAVGSVTGNVGGSVASVTNAVTVGTINANTITAASIAASALNGKGDWNVGKTGYALTAAYDAAKVAASQTSVDVLATYVDTEVAAIKAKTDNLPANPAAVSDIPTANQNRDAVFNAMPTAGWTNGSFGDRLLIGDTAQRNVAVTGAHHVAADIHELQPAVITAGDFAAGAIDANALAADAAAEIAVRVADEPLAGHTTAGTLGKVLSDAGSGITTLLGRITSTVYTMFTDLVQMIVNDGTASAQWSSTAMQNIPDAGGTGARSVTLTVRDSSSNPIQNASVRVYRTGESFILSTNASGVAAFSLDDATWTVAITATGFSFTPVSLVISGNTSQAYTMTTAGGGVTPSEPPFCTGFWTVYNQNGTIQAGAQVSIQASSPPVGSTGIVMEDAVRTATADNNGVVQFSNLIKGATYIVYRTGSSRKFTITVPTNAGNTQALGSIVG